MNFHENHNHTKETRRTFSSDDQEKDTSVLNDNFRMHFPRTICLVLSCTVVILIWLYVGGILVVRGNILGTSFWSAHNSDYKIAPRQNNFSILTVLRKVDVRQEVDVELRARAVKTAMIHPKENSTSSKGRKKRRVTAVAITEKEITASTRRRRRRRRSSTTTASAAVATETERQFAKNFHQFQAQQKQQQQEQHRQLSAQQCDITTVPFNNSAAVIPYNRRNNSNKNNYKKNKNNHDNSQDLITSTTSTTTTAAADSVPPPEQELPPATSYSITTTYGTNFCHSWHAKGRCFVKLFMNDTNHLLLEGDGNSNSTTATTTTTPTTSYYKSIDGSRKFTERGELIPAANEVPLAQYDFPATQGQDLIVLKLLGFKRKGYFVDLAARFWHRGSNSFALEQYFDWSGICVEPDSRWYQGLVMNRTCAVVCNTIVSNVDGNEHYFNYQVFGLGGHRKHSGGGDSGNKPTVTLSTILKYSQAPAVIDYLSLDVEGFEEKVLMGFNFSRYRFNIISIERPTGELHRYLAKNGYWWLTQLEGNFGESMYIHESISHFREFMNEYRPSASDYWRGWHNRFVRYPAWETDSYNNHTHNNVSNNNNNSSKESIMMSIDDHISRNSSNNMTRFATIASSRQEETSIIGNSEKPIVMSVRHNNSQCFVSSSSSSSPNNNNNNINNNNNLVNNSNSTNNNDHINQNITSTITAGTRSTELSSSNSRSTMTMTMTLRRDFESLQARADCVQTSIPNKDIPNQHMKKHKTNNKSKKRYIKRNQPGTTTAASNKLATAATSSSSSSSSSSPSSSKSCYFCSSSASANSASALLRRSPHVSTAAVSSSENN